MLVAAAFDCWKEKCMDRFDGAFAFAICNTESGEVFLVRDRLGERPLFYYGDFRERGRFVQFLFASNMKALWSIGAPKNLDATMMLHYITLGYTRNPNKKMATFYSDILSLPPGHYLKISPQKGKTQMRNWYRPNMQNLENISDSDAIEQFNTLLNNSISNRISDEKTVGLYSHNDLYSAAIETTIQKTSHCSVKIFSSDSDIDDDFSDLQNVLFQDFNTFCSIQEEPVSNMDSFLFYQVIQHAKQQGIDIVLDSLGAKTILGGSLDYIGYYLQYLLRKDYSLFKKEKRLFRANGFLSHWKLQNYINAYAPEKRAKSVQNSLIKTLNNFPFLNEEFLLRYQNEDLLRQPEIHKPEDAMYFDLFTLGAEEQLIQKGKIADFFSKEMRFPFLQYQLVALLFSLPSNYKFRDGYNQWILRKSLEHKHSSDFVWQKAVPENPIMSPTVPAKQIHSAKQTLVEAKIFTKDLVEKKTKKIPNEKEFEWRIVNAAYYIDDSK